VRALQKPAAGDRIAATWYGGSITIDINPGDTQLHRLALYLLDWDGPNRREMVDIVNPTTGAVLDTRTAQSFAGGQYWMWQVSGTVRVRITAIAGLNAAVSAVFLDAAAGGNQAPTGTVTQVAFYAGSTLLATVPRVAGELQADPYVATWSSVPVGTYGVTAVATDNGGATRTSAMATITV